MEVRRTKETRNETDRRGRERRDVNSLTNSRATEPNSQTEDGKEVGGSEDERESGYDSVDPLRGRECD